MALYVAFLGSIASHGERLLMEDLRRALWREDFDDVETVVAEDNILFRHEERPTQGLSEKLAYILLDRFEIDNVAPVRSREELLAVIAENPFTERFGPEGARTMFLAQQPFPEQFELLESQFGGRGPELVAPGTRALHCAYPEGSKGTPLTADFIERRLGCRGTMRRLGDLQRIADKMDEN